MDAWTKLQLQRYWARVSAQLRQQLLNAPAHVEVLTSLEEIERAQRMFGEVGRGDQENAR